MRIAFAFLILAAFGGCGKQIKPPQAHGNFAQVDSVGLVQDAMNMMVAVYPPAKTRLEIVQDSGDPFGIALVENLRANGYAIAESAPPQQGDKYASPVDRLDGLPFSYLIDYLQTEDELRVTLSIGSDSASRLYRVQEHPNGPQYIPAGNWVRKQG